MEIHKTLHL